MAKKGENKHMKNIKFITITSIITAIIAIISSIRAFLNIGQTSHIIVGLLWLSMFLSITETLFRDKQDPIEK